MSKEVIKFSQNMCNAKVDDNSVLFVRVSGVVRHKDARLEVPITHTAIVIKGGGDMRYYKSGTYDLFDSKDEVRDWKSGQSVEVIYIPKDTRVVIKWGTPAKIVYRDAASGKVINVGARGEFDVSVTNPEQFYRKVVGVKKEFDLEEFRRRFGQTVASEFTDIFLKVVEEKKLSYDRFTACKKEIGDRTCEILNPEFEKEWGMSVMHFIIEGFTLDEGTIDAIEAGAAEASRKAAAAGAAVCPACGASVSADDVFCPKCGARVDGKIKCASCGKLIPGDSLFCPECGKKVKPVKGDE